MGEIFPGGARDDPSESVGIDRLVSESLSMGAFLFHGLQVFEIPVRALVVRRFGQRARGLRVDPDVGIRIGVVLAVIERGGHVHDLPHRGAAKRALLEFGHDRGDLGGLVERSLGHENLREESRHGLGHRHGGVLSGLVEGTEVLLIHDPALVKDEHSIRVVGRQRFLPGHGLLAAERREGHRVDAVIQGVGHRARRAEPPAHLLGGHQLPDVADGPSHLREAEEVRIRLHDELVRGRREALHPAEPHGIGFRGVEGRGFPGLGRGDEGKGSGQAAHHGRVSLVVDNDIEECSCPVGRVYLPRRP